MTAELLRDGYAAVPTTPRQDCIPEDEKYCSYVDIALLGSLVKPPRIPGNFVAPKELLQQALLSKVEKVNALGQA